MKNTPTRIALAALLLSCAIGATADPHVLYVGPGGNDANTGLSDNEPRLTIGSALATMEAYSDIDTVGGTIYLLDGTYANETPVNMPSSTDHSAIALTHPIAIEGASGDPTKVIVKRQSTDKFRLFYLNHADAAVRHVTITGGQCTDAWQYGGGVQIDSAGGTVDHCIVENCKTGGNGQQGAAGIYMKSGRVSHTIIRNCEAINVRNYGAGIYAEGGLIDNSLVTGCKNFHHPRPNGNAAVCLMGTATMVNCTVAKNTSCLVTGIWVGAANARAINCVSYGNGFCGKANEHEEAWQMQYSGCFASGDVGQTGRIPGANASMTGAFVSCASENYPAGSSGCVTLSSSPFADFDNSNYTIQNNASLIANAGNTALAESIMDSTTDLAGAVRCSGVQIDIGAYELPEGFSVRARADKTTLMIPDDNPVTFTAETSGGTGTVTYTWDFGDGSANLVTTESVVTHNYAVAGSFTVVVSATDGSQSASYTFPKPFAVSAFTCDFVMLTTNVMVGAEAAFRAENLQSSTTPTFTWNFGDGTPAVSTNALEISHAYQAAGKYTVSVVANAGSDGSLNFAFDTTVDVIQRDIYVNRTGAGTFPFDTAAKGAKTPGDALQYAVDGCVIHVMPGNYDLRGKETNVMRGIRMVGEGETPEGVIFRGYGTDSGVRNLRVEHTDAWVENLTLEGGFASYATGGNLYLGAGTVTNCILRNGRSNSSGGGGGGAFVKGGVLTHCIVTNSYLGNRGNGIILNQTGGRVSNCLIGYNKLEWLQSRNAFSLVYVTGGSIDNCTIVGGRILKYDANWPAQMGNQSDKGVNIGANAYATNVVIADLHYISHSATDRADLLNDTVATWAGTAANFVNCATDDISAINETCSMGSTATFFADYAAGDLTPKIGGPLFSKGIVVAGMPAVDLAGNPRVSGSAIDIGCYESQLDPRTIIFLQ